MRETAIFLVGALAGGIVCYGVFVDHFAARIEQRVRTVLTSERQKFTNAIAIGGKDLAAAGQGIAGKISSESSKL